MLKEEAATMTTALRATLAACLTALTCLLWAAPLQAFSIEFKGRGIKRTILAIYDSKAEESLNKTRIHKLAEMPLNHLGFIVEYHDINQPLPALATMAKYRAVLTWFVEDLAAPGAYLTWLDQVTADGVKLVALGEIAPREVDELMPLVNRVLGRLGLRSASFFAELTHKAKVTFSDPAMIGFEQKLNKVIPGFPVIETRAQTVRAHLTIELPTAAGVIKTHPVSTSENGGYAAQNFTIDNDANTNRLSWLINPFQFFKLALGDERFPIPDVTTVSGRRIYFSHIDGDGWNNLSEVEGYRETQTLSADVVAKEAIAAFPDLPVSVGLIAADVQPLLGGNADGIKAARLLFAMPHVEVASHTHTHPYNWSFFERYQREAEVSKMRAYRPPDMPLRERVTAAMMKVAGKTYINPRYDENISGSDELPRTYLREPFELEKEVIGALKLSERFAPPGKRAQLYLWSGDTTPFEGAIHATRMAKVRNLNGGDSRLDAEYPSVAYVPPLSRIVGQQRQIYAVNSNENTYTNDWTGPFGGQMMLEHTLRNTETPRRLKGFNLYYHMYSGEKQASLRAIKYFLAMARSAEVTPIDASHYAAMADDYFGVDIEQVELFAWAIKDRGAVQSLRFDEADKLAIDLVKSIGVIGTNRTGSSVYVSLDPAIARAVVALKARPDVEAPAAAAAREGEPLLSLVHSRWRFVNQTAKDCLYSVTATGFGAGEMLWQTEPGRGFKIKVTRAGTTLAEEVRWADATGRLALRIQVDAIKPVDLAFQCHD
jgi:polysaccharide biosynthesis protein PelA